MSTHVEHPPKKEMATPPPLFISLGSDCAVAECLRDAGHRDAAYPFDWCVSYGGVGEIMRDALEKRDTCDAVCAVDGGNFNARYGVFHMHASFPMALPTMTRRFDRLCAAIMGDRPAVFIRRSHPLHHHLERGGVAMVDEVADAREIARVIEVANPRGHHRVELMLACDLCHPKVDPVEAAAGLTNLRVHNLTRGGSGSFAEQFPTKTYKDAMVACIEALVGEPQKKRVDDGPYTLEV